VLQDTGDSEDVLENSDQIRECSQQSEDVFRIRYKKYQTGIQGRGKVQVQVGGTSCLSTANSLGLYILFWVQ